MQKKQRKNKIDVSNQLVWTIQALIAWFNFIFLNCSGFFMVYFYILSLMPAMREERIGERAWQECAKYRTIGGFFEFVIFINLTFWIWFPISALNWVVCPNFLVMIIIGICIAIPCIIIMLKGVKDAGAETLKPSKDTQMYGGIYKYIRHPQTVGEFPLFIAYGIALNSIFLLIWTTLWVLISVPIIMHFEEKDLIKRFGDAYLDYKQKTGAFFPKLRKRAK